MPDKFIYLIINLGAFIVPFLFSFHKKIRFYKEWKSFFPALLITAILFVAWDCLYTFLGVWGFNNRYLTGFFIFNLPVEEVLFFICIPYSSIFTYYCFTRFKLNSQFIPARWVSALITGLLLVMAIIYLNRLYTVATFISLSALIAGVSYYKRKLWLNDFYLMYVVILIPFFIVNGLLTGTGIDEPVVWYNNAENMGLRALTIPFEDFFYGMLLLLLNTLLFEYFRKKNAKKEVADISI